MMREENVRGVGGLTMMREFVTEEEEAQLVATLTAEVPPFPKDIVGPRDYRTRKTWFFRNPNGQPKGWPVGVFPDFDALTLRTEEYTGAKFDVVMANHYARGHSLEPHVDSSYRFVSMLNLENDTVMDMRLFTEGRTSPLTASRQTRLLRIPWPRRALLLMRDQAAQKWHHGGTNMPDRCSVIFREA